MAQNPPLASGDVVAWGNDTEPQRGPLTAIAARLGTKERHIVVGLAGTGAVLAGLSLLASWQVVTMPASRPQRVPPTVPMSVADLGTWGTTYLVGLMGLLAAAALLQFGSPALHRPARIAGLGWAAGLLAVLVGTL